MVFLKEFSEEVDFEKTQQTTKKHAKLLSWQRVNKSTLILWLLVSSADNLCKQFGSRSFRAWSGSKLFDTLMVFLKEFSDEVDLEKIQLTTKKHAKLLCRQRVNKSTLILWLLVSSADNFYKLFGSRSGQTRCRAWSGSKLFVTLMLFLKEFSEEVDFEKNQQTTKKHAKLLSRQRVNKSTLILWLLVSSADNLYKQSRSGTAKCRVRSGSKLFDTLMVFLKEFFLKKLILKKISRRQKSLQNYPVGKELNILSALMTI